AVVFAPVLWGRLAGPVAAPPWPSLSRWTPPRFRRVGGGGEGGMKSGGALAPPPPARPPPPLASVIARIAAHCHGSCSVDPAGIQPLYVRRPDAEIARDAVRR